MINHITDGRDQKQRRNRPIGDGNGYSDDDQHRQNAKFRHGKHDNGQQAQKGKDNDVFAFHILSRFNGFSVCLPVLKSLIGI